MLAFWSAALGYEIDGDHLRPPPDAEPGSPTVWLQRTVESKRGKLRGHVDLYVAADGSLAGEVRRLIALGARRVDVGQTGEEGSRCWPTPRATSSACCTNAGAADSASLARCHICCGHVPKVW